jgi:hypothetical protein
VSNGRLNFSPPKNRIRFIALMRHNPYGNFGSVVPKTAPEKALPLIDHLHPRAIGRRGFLALERALINPRVARAHAIGLTRA